MFSRIMVSIESYYNITDLVPSSTGYFPLSPGSPSVIHLILALIWNLINNVAFTVAKWAKQAIWDWGCKQIE